MKVVKNKVAPPFKEAEFDIMYGEGISKEGELLDLAVKLDIVQKSGAWFSYKEERLGQGRDNVKELFKGNPELTAEIEALVRANLDKLNPSRTKTNREPVEIPLAAAAKMSAPAAKAAIDIVVDDE